VCLFSHKVNRRTSKCQPILFFPLQVGENFSDKPLLPFAGNFESLDNTGEITMGHLAASGEVPISGGQSKLVLVEEFNYGVPGLLKLMGAWRNNLPALAREGHSADLVFSFIDFCADEIEKSGSPSFLCDAFVAQIENGCDRTTGMTVVLANPSSKGKVSVDWWGRIKIVGGFLTTKDDIEALGAAARSVFEQLSARATGPAALQTPCADPNDNSCKAHSCPDINEELLADGRAVMTVLNKKAAQAIPYGAPASMVSPNFIESYLESSDDNFTVGKLLSQWITAGYHYCGTAGVGKVTDENLKVIGAEGLFISDASAIPKTPRVNNMATVYMIARVAALKFIKERTQT